MEYNTGKKQSLVAGQFDLLMQNVTGYIETRVEIAKLDARSEAGNVISLMITALGAALFIGMSVIFLLVGCALALGEWLGHNSWGFFIVFGVFAILSIVYYLNFVKIEKFMNVIMDNQLKRISERENAAEEAVEPPKENLEPLPSDTVIKKPIPKSLDEMSKAELNHLELADNEELTPVQKASEEKENEKTIFAPKKEEE